jgi:hypothetical protein
MTDAEELRDALRQLLADVDYHRLHGGDAPRADRRTRSLATAPRCTANGCKRLANDGGPTCGPSCYQHPQNALRRLADPSSAATPTTQETK